MAPQRGFSVKCLGPVYKYISHLRQLEKTRSRMSQKMPDKPQLEFRSKISGWLKHQADCLPPLSPAKEALQLPIIDLYTTLAEPKTSENKNDSSPGGSQMIWNSSALYPPFEYAGMFNISEFKLDDDRDACGDPTYVDETHKWHTSGFLKECSEEWGSLRPPFPPARIGKLFDRDYVWVVTQTMVSFENLTLWAINSLLAYKVYPSFWGRINMHFLGCKN